MAKKILLFAAPVAIVFFASLFASAFPDTLEYIAENFNFSYAAKESGALFGDYHLGIISNEFLSTFIAGLIGLILLFILYKIINAIFWRLVK